MTATVVVVSYRPGDWLAPCLASVAGQAEQVVLVDNGSEGAAASVIGRRCGVEVIRSAVNLGFAPAVNLGALAATGEVLALLNDDATAAPNWLAAASKALADPSVAAVGPKVVLARRYREIVYPDQEWKAPGDDRPLGRQVRSVQVNGVELLETAAGPGLHRLERGSGTDRWRWTAGPRPWYVPLPEYVPLPDQATAGPEVEVRVDGEVAPPGPVVRLLNSAGAFLDDRGYAGDIGSETADDGRFNARGERFAISGVAFATRKETWRRLGPFAARFFAYYEDVDWCWRARLAGLTVLYDPSATVAHWRSASSGGEHEPQVRVMAERNRTLTMVRNGPRRLVLRALWARAGNGADGGVRSGIARLLPWGVASRARLARSWQLTPEEVWSRWAGEGTQWADGPADSPAYLT